MSALLTTTMPYMKVVVDTLIEKGLRDKYIVLVGGAPLNEEFGVAVGADAYCRDAAVASETAKALVSARRDRLRAEPPARRWPEPGTMGMTVAPLVIACGALATELRSVLSSQGLAGAVEITYLPANLHNRPERIVPELEPLLAAAALGDRPVFVAYADCGTGGALDALLAQHPGVTRLPGSHCYEFFSGAEQFAAMHEEELGTLFLTDFLAKHFDALLWQGLGLDRHPQLRDMYFGNYRRVVLISQIGPRCGRRRRSCRRRPAWDSTSSTVTSASCHSPWRSPMASPSPHRGGSADGPRRPERP